MHRLAATALQLATRGLRSSQGSASLLQYQSTRGLGLLSFLGLGEDTSEPVEVCFVDPKSLLIEDLRKELSKDLAHHTTSVVIPGPMVPLLSKGEFELGDHDDPMNSWYFGQTAEIFEYQLVDVHPVASGFTSIIRRDKLQEVLEGDAVGLPTWADFKERLLHEKVKFPSKRPPVLFAGAMMHTHEAAVYKLVREGQLQGLLVSSETADSGAE